MLFSDGDKTAVISQHEDIAKTFSELSADVNQAARVLKTLGKLNVARHAYNSGFVSVQELKEATLSVCGHVTLINGLSFNMRAHVLAQCCAL